MTISERMKAAVQKNQWSLSELARRAGVPQPTVHRISTGDSVSPRRETVDRIAKALGVSAEWLWSGQGGDSLERDGDLSELSLWDEKTPVDADEVAVPFLREVELAAGPGLFAIKEDESATLRFNKKNLRDSGVQFNMAKCVTVRGNSMLPVLRDGATVGLDLGKSQLVDIIDGDLYALSHNGQLRIKQVYRLPTGIRLRSFNREDHPDEDYTFQEMEAEELSIIGRVFWWGMYA